MKAWKSFATAALLFVSVHGICDDQSDLLASQQQAIALYPDLAVAGSAFHTLFMRAAAQKRQTDPDFMSHTYWPLALAKTLLPPPQSVQYSVKQALEGGAICYVNGGVFYIDGLKAFDNDRGTANVWRAPDFGGQTVGAGYKKYPALTISASKALEVSQQ